MEAEVRTRPQAAADAERRAYPPISDYAVIGDCRTMALVSSQGSIDWLCLPHFSGPSVFSALLDRANGGCFAVHPSGRYTSERRYIGDTPVLQTTFRSPTGVLVVTDLMPVLPEKRYDESLRPQRELLRCLTVSSGEVEIDVRYAPRPDYARRAPRLQRRGACGWACADRDSLYLLHTDIDLQPLPDGTELRGRARLRAGEKRFLSLTYVKADIGVMLPLGAQAEGRIAATQQWWQAWAHRCHYCGAYRTPVIRSMLTLKLLCYELSGAVVAAATTSLPEAPGGVRNWDYRYCWLRDASRTRGTMMDLGYDGEADAFLGWLLHATRLTWPKLQVLYDVYGETSVPEQRLDHLEGYAGARPVRIGNAAHRQLQLDAYGSVVLAAYDFATHGGVLNPYEARFLRGLGNTVCRSWRLPDHGIWEMPGGPRHHTYSKLMCWVALDRLLRLNAMGKIQVPAARFGAARDAIAVAIETHGYNAELGGYSAYFDAPFPDASLLLMARYNYRPAGDPRLAATFERIERDLAEGELLRRYPAGCDGLPGREGAFVITSFWAVDYLARCGRVAQARERFEQLLARANDVGLYSEEIDGQTGAALGNFPQAFSHVGLIVTALTLDDTEQGKSAAS
ncbi:MAG: glycoside hydrolase family 15 protein [Sulfurifustaceae bacterium]